MHIKINFQGKIEGCKEAVYRLKLSVSAMYLVCVHCTLNIFSYEISISCGTFRKHDREPLYGHGNTVDRGLPV
jgi:hypothetical protein